METTQEKDNCLAEETSSKVSCGSGGDGRGDQKLGMHQLWHSDGGLATNPPDGPLIAANTPPSSLTFLSFWKLHSTAP